MNRRQFLEPVLSVKGALPRPDEVFQTAIQVPLLSVARRAMATTFELLLPFGTHRGRAAAEAALDVIDRIEERLTVYRDDSEVSAVNRNAGAGFVTVRRELFELLQLSAQISSSTQGAFDITSGPLVRAWGFYRRQGRIPKPAERESARRCVGMRFVELDSSARSLRFTRDGMEINLGSIGKGFALDRAANVIRRRFGIESALLHGGGSSVLARGCQPGEARGWPIGLKHPWDGTRRLGVVYLRNRGLGTSAASYQHLEYNNRKLGHIIDPRTGWPAVGIASATAIAPTAAEADALATAFFILGVEKTRLYCQAHPNVGAILLPDGDNAETIVFGLSSDEYDRTETTIAPADRDES
jgi:thiamine biosynthesis lipoprotein